MPIRKRFVVIDTQPCAFDPRAAVLLKRLLEKDAKTRKEDVVVERTLTPEQAAMLECRRAYQDVRVAARTAQRGDRAVDRCQEE